MRLNPWHALAALIGFLAGLVVDQVWRPTPPDVRVWEARVQAYQKDSLAFERVIASLHGAVARLEDSARVATIQALVYKAQADQDREVAEGAGARADSAISKLASLRTAKDSIVIVTNAYEARTEEAAGLRREAGSLREAFALQIEATARLTAALDTSGAEVDLLNRRLAIADDLLRDRPATDRCRVLWFNCPSRTASFVVGAVAGLAGAVLVTR